jgi:hypothetical protein
VRRVLALLADPSRGDGEGRVDPTVRVHHAYVRIGKIDGEGS